MMRQSKSLILAGTSVVALVAVLFQYLQTSSVSITVGNLTYKGTLSQSARVAIFYGIPYAQPPLAKLRFRAPVPLEFGTDSSQPSKVVDGRKEPAFCVQSTMFPSDTEREGAGSEDCLHLNIYLSAERAKVLASSPTTPAKALQPVPVMVYIHGGGFLGGNPLSWPFDHWIEQSPDLVIVSVYYRLNIFGFLAAPSEENAAEMDYNVGILDQVEALKWVQKNIAIFGGDPKKVTIAGHSAGAASVFLLMVANDGRQDLFQQAIAQSVYRPAISTISGSKDHFEWVAKEAGCPVEQASRAQQVDCLRTKDVATLIRASELAQLHQWSWKFRPVVDNNLFKAYPTVLLNDGKVSAVPLLVGATSNETYVIEGDLKYDLRRWYPQLTDEDIGRIAGIYDERQFPSELERAKAAVGESLNRCARELLALSLTKAGKPVYAYRFDQRVPTQPEEGVQHSAENYFMFRGVTTGSNGTFSFASPESVPRAFSRELISYWTSFARTGNPNSYKANDVPHWPQWETRRLWNLWKSGPWRMVLRASDPNSIDQRGSKQEHVPNEQSKRCMAMGDLAEILRN